MTGALGRIIRRAGNEPEPVGERCDLCAVGLPDPHRHLFDTDRHEIRCVCQACSLLFTREAASDGHYRLIPRRRLRLPDVPTAGLGVPGRPAGRSTRPRGATSSRVARRWPTWHRRSRRCW
jgi:hypothetical protein